MRGMEEPSFPSPSVLAWPCFSPLGPGQAGRRCVSGNVLSGGGGCRKGPGLDISWTRGSSAPKCQPVAGAGDLAPLVPASSSVKTDEGLS